MYPVPTASSLGMKNKKFEDVSVVVIEPNSSVRRALKEAFNRLGIKNAADGGRFDELEDLLTEIIPDLLICDAGLKEGDVCSLSQKIRHGAIGQNPFLIMIATTEAPTENTVRRIIDSGPDCIVAKPLSIKSVLDRVHALGRRRRPFSISSDYFGPDRHIGPRQDIAAPTMPVPNSLAAKLNGKYDQTAFNEEIKSALSHAMEQKIVHNSKMINAIVGQILPFYAAGAASDAVFVHLNRLLTVGRDIALRVTGTEDQHVAPLCESLVKVTRTIKDNHRSPNRKDLDLLRNVTAAIFKAFQPEAGTEDFSHKIAEYIEGSRRYGTG